MDQKPSRTSEQSNITRCMINVENQIVILCTSNQELEIKF
jgi:hypothetical protein